MVAAKSSIDVKINKLKLHGKVLKILFIPNSTLP
jgi:hypothetical protein